MVRHLFEVPFVSSSPLQDYRDFPGLSPLIDDIIAKAAAIGKKLQKRQIWMLNSTASGGGVAEMMPSMISLFHDLKLPVHWLVMQPKEPAFFLLTKKIHTMLHGRTESGADIAMQERELYDYDSRIVAQEILRTIDPKDLLIVHDPQPLGSGFFLAQQRPEQNLLWRCHIGTEFSNASSTAAWKFLQPYITPYKEVFMTHEDYIPDFLSKKAGTLYPAIDPLSSKNKWLSTEEMVEIFRMSGLHGKRLSGYKKPVKRLYADGKIRATTSLNHLIDPYILQISRWDHLKGFIPLMNGFLYMKRKAKSNHYAGLTHLTTHMLQNSALVLAGPEIGTVADDPEPALVLDEILQFYQSLPAHEQKQIYIYLLPMASVEENALIVNALQRGAEVIVQNSIREGFGLTVTEALWKEIPVLATDVGGIRIQLNEGRSGLSIDDPHNDREVGQKLLFLLTHEQERRRMARHGWLLAIDHFLMPALVNKYLSIFERYL